MLTIMVGLPRSGKNTWVDKNKGDAIVVEPDWIRSEIFGHQFHGPAESHIWAITDATIRLLLCQDKEVILNATNLTKDIRAKYYKIAFDCGTRPKVIWIDTDKEVCKERNEKSPEGEKLPPELITAMSVRLDKPTTFEIPDVERIEG